MRTAQNFGRALSFIKLSYVRYRLKTVTEPHTFLEQESESSRPDLAFKVAAQATSYRCGRLSLRTPPWLVPQ